MDAAVECLEFLPKGVDILDLSLSEDTETTRKLRMYQAIADHYLACTTPMWSDHFMDLHLSLFNLLMQGKTDIVRRALCLSLLLLPAHIKEQLKRLLRFIEVACDESDVQLSVKVITPCFKLRSNSQRRLFFCTIFFLIHVYTKAKMLSHAMFVELLTWLLVSYVQGHVFCVEIVILPIRTVQNYYSRF